MIAVILFTLLFIVVSGALIFFLYRVLLVSLKDQKINVRDNLFSRDEIKFVSGHPEFKKAETGLKAVVLCSEKKSFSVKNFEYNGKKDCSLFVNLYDGEYDCTSGCIGFGNCLSSCGRNSIRIIKNTAVIDGSCNGCGLCVDSCPKHLIKLIPKDSEEYMLCNSNGQVSKESCSEADNVTKLSLNYQKYFQFWRKLYRMLIRK